MFAANAEKYPNKGHKHTTTHHFIANNTPTTSTPSNYITWSSTTHQKHDEMTMKYEHNWTYISQLSSHDASNIDTSFCEVVGVTCAWISWLFIQSSCRNKENGNYSLLPNFIWWSFTYAVWMFGGRMQEEVQRWRQTKIALDWSSSLPKDLPFPFKKEKDKEEGRKVRSLSCILWWCDCCLGWFFWFNVSLLTCITALQRRV
jgi:hypothetical protein